jgi:peptidoglycan/LPS O-acetylase OafA/YrhL
MENTSLAPITVMSPQKQGVSIATLLLGVWVIVAGFILAAKPAGMRNNITVGILLFIFSALRLRRNSSAAWSWANAVLGFWILAGPQALAYSSSPLRWNDFALGWATIALSILGATGHDRLARRGFPVQGDTTEEHRAA